MKTLGIIFMFIFVASNATAQRHQSADMFKKMNEKKWAYVVEHLEFDAAEKKTVYAIFMEHENAMLELYKRMHNGRDAKVSCSEMTDAEFEEMNERWIAHEREKVRILESTHAALKEVLSPKQLFLYYRVDRNFRKELFSKQHNGKNRNREGCMPPP